MTIWIPGVSTLVVNNCKNIGFLDMKNLFLSILIVVLMYCEVAVADNYAILISAGKATSDTELTNSEYWFDLFLVYEYLLLEEQYDPSQVFVFYGDGNDYTSGNLRYRKETHNWTQVADFDNSYLTLDSVISSLDNVITDDDNLLFYWVVGHGDKTNPFDDDNYCAYVNPDFDNPYNSDTYCLSKSDLVSLVNSITHYRKRKIFWMTCHSGSMGIGSINLKNDKTTLITSSPASELSYSTAINNEPHSAFNFALFSLSTGYFPNGTTCDISQVCTDVDDIDYMLSIDELYAGINTFSYLDINTLNCPLNPCLFDQGGISNKIFIGEYKNISNVTYYFNSSYWLDQIEISNVRYDDDYDISIEADEWCLLKRNIFVPLNSTLIIK